MRIDWCDDEETPGQFALWDANCERSLAGKAGQAALRDFEAALVAMPSKRLIHGRLVEGDEVCAVGCYARHRGLDLSKFDPEDETDAVGVKAGMPRLVAWKVVALNDVELESRYETAEGPNPAPYGTMAGYSVRIDVTPEERYQRVLAWVRSHLRAEAVQP